MEALENATHAADAAHVRQRSEMIEVIRRHAADCAWQTGRPRLSEAVLEAMRQVPRHAFVAPDVRHYAYIDSAMAIGFGQTISQPFIVALMTDLLEPQPHHNVLEVGTGCGYQTAVLAGLVRHVYSIEIIEELAEDAGLRLRKLGYANVTVAQRDGHSGWPEHAPYDGIVVTAAATRVPPALIDQLAPGGKLVIPIGGRWLGQSLNVIEKAPSGECTAREVLPVAFVPFTGGSREEDA
jgi:protein-L-isoaspartate(D-aspartate) O-methyltransferase